MTATNRTAMDGAVRHLVTQYNPGGNRVGWLMMSSILVEAWDLYSIAFVLVFIKDQYHPDPLLLGLAAAGTQGGGAVDKQARLPLFCAGRHFARKEQREARHVDGSNGNG